jgi:exodeoxyribonuclease-3
MRLITWNTLNGGQDGQLSDRLRRVVEVVRREEPDIVLLQEVRGFESNGHYILHDVENELDMRGFFASTDTGYHLASYIHRDQRVTASEVDNRNFFHAMLRLDLSFGEDLHLNIINTHLCPHSSLTRLAEAQHLARFAAVGSHVFVAGDFNSLDPYTDYSDALQQMPAHYRARYLVPGDASTPDTRVARTLEVAGFVDTGYLCGEGKYTIPTSLPVYGCEFGKLRLDYVYATASLASSVTDFRIVRTDLADKSSDHYPVVVDFDLAESDLSSRRGSI